MDLIFICVAIQSLEISTEIGGKLSKSYPQGYDHLGVATLQKVLFCFYGKQRKNRKMLNFIMCSLCTLQYAPLLLMMKCSFHRQR